MDCVWLHSNNFHKMEQKVLMLFKICYKTYCHNESEVALIENSALKVNFCDVFICTWQNALTSCVCQTSWIPVGFLAAVLERNKHIIDWPIEYQTKHNVSLTLYTYIVLICLNSFLWCTTTATYFYIGTQFKTALSVKWMVQCKIVSTVIEIYSH